MKRPDFRLYKKFKLDQEAEPYLTYIYSLHDTAASFFEDPLASALPPEHMLVKMKRAALNGAFKYPNDLTLCLIAVFDSRNGRLVEATTYEVGSLYIGDFARKVNKDGNVPTQNQEAA